MSRRILFAVTALCAFCLPAFAEGITLSSVQAAFITKILAYDRNIGTLESDGSINVGILYGADGASEADARSMMAEFSKVKEKNIRVKECGFQASLLAYAGTARLQEEIAARKIKVLYLLVEDGKDVEEIIRLTGNLKVLSITGSRAAEQVKNGVSVGIDSEEGKPVILVNLESALREGRDFVPQFLSLVKIVK